MKLFAKVPECLKHALGERCVAHLQRLPGDLDKNVDEILAEVDKDRNGEVDYEEVSCLCISAKLLHSVRKALELAVQKGCP